MPSDTSLKILIALNAVQIFITLLLIATMASTGINAKSSEAGYGGLSSRPSLAEDPYDASGQPAYGSGDSQSIATDAKGVIPPGAPEDSAAAGDDTSQGDDAPDEAAIEAKKAERNKVILRTYLNLVARRLEIAAKDADVDPGPYLPDPDAITAAIESGDTESEPFQAALDLLKTGYSELEMDFPSPPGSKAKEASE